MDITHISIVTLPYIIGAFSFLLLGIKLVIQIAPKATRKANSILALLCLVFVTIEVDQFISANALSFALYTVFENIQNAAHLLLGPLTYLYLNAMSDAPPSDKKTKIHFWGFAAGLTLMWLPLSNDITWGLFICLYFLTLMPYAHLCLKELSSFDSGAKKQVSDLQHHNLVGIKVWVYLLVFLSLYVFLSPIYKWVSESSNGPLDVHYILAVFAAYLLIRPDFTSQIALSDLQVHQPEDHRLQQQSSTEEAVGPVSMDCDNHVIFSDLDNKVKESRLYLQNGLSLTDLATLTGYSNNQISSAINHVYGQCFYDYVNMHRIEEAKRILVTSPAKSVTDVAIASGFNSKSSFYKAFSKQGIGTPSEFKRKSLTPSQ
ncbi:helix-turn-helix domain-containing protein [Vibrio amylolyticus]|uniref:AraC family transcriptional regulator n=1 Tax=Vibrio amylolyticus TaxID=2847292 RepID=UPI00354BB256